MNLLGKLSRIIEEKITAINFMKWKFKKFGVPLIRWDSHIVDNIGKEMTVEMAQNIALIISFFYSPFEELRRLRVNYKTFFLFWSCMILFEQKTTAINFMK